MQKNKLLTSTIFPFFRLFPKQKEFSYDCAALNS